MIHLETTIRIYAPYEKVWQILTDFESYPSWNPFIRQISGELREGQKLQVKISPPNEKEMSFSPMVIRTLPGRELRWSGKFLFKGLFDGEHYFGLEEIDENTTLFVHGEYFSGLLVGLMSSMLEQTKSGFDQMNQALKKTCEC
ncbi:SRPBCC domain-containing protein [Aquiflexum gelatinilyticum]|uniref:SRPBCC domain-containing protein n=1 Tax=Aquiflexum gelatinilyticum TaxID=2961943 RepID=A0A9X2PBJ9_9BACT|nr:SRPBCC domain-containing protein [Aquiflexum gelatinilyticum]MCR9015715.1 SRPBCC domain-containing protein [Aquiflexum gelatinilyticum]